MGFQFSQGDRPLPGYTIQRGVGRGGFGEVYYSTSDGGKEVALKYLRENPQVELRGVMHCLNLKSPYLVAIHDVKQSAAGDYFVIMEYVSGPSLRDLLNNETGGLGPQKAAYFLREIGKGLAYLHDRGIVHRDMKPGNIFYEDGYVKIGDYGLAKIMAASQHSGQTMSVGTVHYMAPEVGSGNYDRTIDIYALGVILYEMLLGKVPFAGATMGEVLMKHLTAQPAVDDLPAPFPNVIRKALAKDPSQRYQTVQEMLTDVFDVADIERSVAAFEPASMTQLAAKVGAQVQESPAGQVALLGTGSSNVGQGVPPPIINPDAVVNAGSGRGWKRLHNRVQRKLDGLAERVDQTDVGRMVAEATPMGGNRGRGTFVAGMVIGGRTKRAEIIAGSIVTAALSSIAIGFVSAEGHSALSAAFSSFILTSAIVAGVIFGTFLAFEKIRATSEWMPRLIVAGLGTFWTGLSISVGEIAYREVHEWFIAVALIMLLSDWIGRFNDGRRGVVSAGRALKVGFFAFIVAKIFDCNGPLVGLAVMMASFLVQMLAGLWPARDAVCAAAGAASPPMPGDFRREPVGAAVSRGEALTAVAPLNRAAARPDSTAAGDPGLMRSSRARLAWLLLSVPMLVSSIGLFIASGLFADNDRQMALFLMGGVGSCVYSLFALSRSWGLRRRGFWRGVLRPFLFTAGVATAGTCGIGAGLLSDNDQIMFLWLLGTIAGGVVALVVWLVPVAPWQPPSQSAEALILRERSRARWTLGIGISLFCSLMIVVPVLVNVVSPHDQDTVIPAFGIPILTGAITLTTLGKLRLRRLKSNNRKDALALPLKRVFEVYDTKQFERILERHLQSIGYKLASKENLLWTFTRGQWHAQFWQKDVRQWRTTLNVAAYETYDGGGRITCYLDLERSFGDPNRKQLAFLDDELDDLRDVVEAREVAAPV